MKTDRKKEKVVNKYKNTEEHNLNSETIIHAKIKEIHEVNKYATRVKVEVLENLKGDFDSEQYLYLPSSVEMSGEYLLFLNNDNNQFE